MDTVREHWAQIVAAVGALVWVLRLEALVRSNSVDITRLREQRNEDLAAARDARNATNEMLREVRADIKTLLRK